MKKEEFKQNPEKTILLAKEILFITLQQLFFDSIKPDL